jgi:hypothetical protein
MNLKNKIILIISPQSWGNMFLAKHHYAIELAKYGNEVYFLNPPQKQKIKSEVEIVKSNVIDSLYLINHSLSFSYKIKFKWIGLFHFLMKFHIKKIEASIGKKIDIVWSFDLGNYYPFKYFSSSSFKLFNPIDEPLNKAGIDAAIDCEIILSITREILEKYPHINVPKHFLHHGLADEFINVETAKKIDDGKIRIGLSGNWLRTDLDKECLLQIINENPTILFEFWGVYQAKQSNIGGGTDTEIKNFIEQLQSNQNVIMHGVVHPKQLAIEFQKMDGFLICYDILKDQSKGTNYHKVMEYISTGKVIVSNNITTYSQLPNLVTMTKERDNNKQLPKLFNEVVANLSHYNQAKFQQERIEFAKNNSYSNKIVAIEKLLVNF